MTTRATTTDRLAGNGLVIERTEKEGGTPWFWISDEHRVSKSQSQTYRHRDTLKASGCRWSTKRHAWYCISAELPEAIAALVGPQDTSSPQDEPPGVTTPTSPPQPMADPYEAARRFREARQAAALQRFAARFQADLERVTRYPALPAVAIVRLDDPWA